MVKLLSTMSTFFVWLGFAALALGVVLISPLLDFLPVDIFQQLFGRGRENNYFRIVESGRNIDPFIWLGLFVAVIGLFLIAIGRYIKLRKRS